MDEAQELREQMLLKAFRELSPYGQKKVIEYAQNIMEKYKHEAEVITFIFLTEGLTLVQTIYSLELRNSMIQRESPLDVLFVLS